MVMLCFVLDLRSISPSLLRDLKQSLLELANFYAVWAPIGEKQRSKRLSDRIGLCYVLKDRSSSSDELKVAYTPRENFSLRDFHHAVNNLPTNAFLPEFNSGAILSDDMDLTTILRNDVWASCGDLEKDIAKKVILISSCVVRNVDPIMKKSLTDAAEKCVSIEFLFLEQESTHIEDLSETISNFVKHISDLENCSFRAHQPDAQVLCGLVIRWLQELKDDMDEPIQARFLFKSNIFGSENLLSCNLSASSNRVVDEFSSCQVCRCHGVSLHDDSHGKQINQPSRCPVTGNDLKTSDLVDNTAKVGDHTILFLPSFQNCVKPQHATPPVDLNIIERTNLGSLSEGLIFGTSFFVTPAIHESDDSDKLEQNAQHFQGLCGVLHSLDQGLICSSKCNLETMKEALFQCYYVLLPSEKGLMLLRRLAGAEEVSPLPDLSHLTDSSSTELQNSIRTSLLKMQVREYNPLLHERGFHQKLNLLVKESLQFGSICSNLKEVICEPSSTQSNFPEEASLPKQTPNFVIVQNSAPQLDLTKEHEASASIADEWDQLIVNESPKRRSPACISKPKLNELVVSQDRSKQLDEKTSRILERLEVPRDLKRKMPLFKSSSCADAGAVTKAPLIPFRSTQGAEQRTTLSQPIRPNFQKLKRKHR